MRERQDQLAKMRSLLFRHEMKAKRVKKIKSKVYHRLLKKDRLKQIGTSIETDPDAAKEHAMKQEFKRAEVISFITFVNLHRSFLCFSGYFLITFVFCATKFYVGTVDPEAQEQLQVGKAHLKTWIGCAR